MSKLKTNPMKKNYTEDFNSDEEVLRYQYKILIKKNDLKASQIKLEFLRKRFSNDYYNDERLENPIYNYISYSFNRHFKFLGNSRAYLSNYREREGSLEISFVILILCGYGGIRETMDYFNEDLEDFFRSDSDLDISIDYEDKSPKSNKRFSKSYKTSLLQLEKQIRKIKRLVYFLMFLILIMGTFLLVGNDKALQDDVIEKMIDKKIEENNSKQKLDYIFKSEVSKNNKEVKSK